MRLVLLSLAAAVLASAVASAENVPGVTGRWYTEGDEENLYVQYLVDRSDDGNFIAQVRSPKVCDTPGWTETGSWTFREATLYHLTKTVDGRDIDPSDPYYENSFVITVVDDDHATMLDLETKITWSMRRVGVDFRFPVLPDCAV